MFNDNDFEITIGDTVPVENTVEFSVKSPEPVLKKGGLQTRQPLNLKIYQLPSAELLQSLDLPSAHEAAKFCELYTSRSNIASKLKRDGFYVYTKQNKLFLFTAKK